MQEPVRLDRVAGGVRGHHTPSIGTGQVTRQDVVQQIRFRQGSERTALPPLPDERPLQCHTVRPRNTTLLGHPGDHCGIH